MASTVTYLLDGNCKTRCPGGNSHTVVSAPIDLGSDAVGTETGCRSGLTSAAFVSLKWRCGPSPRANQQWGYHLTRATDGAFEQQHIEVVAPLEPRVRQDLAHRRTSAQFGRKKWRAV